MSVLYKALQKAAKENEQQAADQADASEADAPNAFASDSMAPTGAISGNRFGKLGANWRVPGIAAALVLALVLVVAFFLVDTDQPAPVQVAQTPAPAPAAPQPAPSQAPAAQEQAAPAPAVSEPAPVAQAPEPIAAEPVEQPSATPDPAPAVAMVEPEPEPVVEAPEPAPAPARVSQAAAPVPPPAAPAPPEPMPELDRDSPTRALSPPISIRRAEAEFVGAGDLVQVREVAQSAQDNVTAGYNALVRGDIGSAIDLYSAALETEPNSVMAQLGRSAALQKSGRLEEARAGYERVLRVDPNNLEALTNLTSIFSTQAPNDALSRLLDLEREYPRFSPVKAQIGLLYARMGSSNQALDYLRQAANMSPGTVMYHYNLAVLLDRMGRNQQAVVSYQRVLAGIINEGVAGDLSRADIERRVRYLKTL